MFSNFTWDIHIEALLPQLGNDGWELVSMVAESSAWGENNAGATTEEKWIFKRPL